MSNCYKSYPLSHPVFDLDDIAIIIEEYIKNNPESVKDMMLLMKKFAEYGILMQGSENSIVLEGEDIFYLIHSSD